MSDDLKWIIPTAIVVIGGGYKLVKWLQNWGVDIDKWDRTATALEKLAGNVSELLNEIRGVNGSGGMREELEEVKRDVKDIKERNAENDLLVDIYKMELIDRKNRGEPMRRDVDHLIQKLMPET